MHNARLALMHDNFMRIRILGNSIVVSKPLNTCMSFIGIVNPLLKSLVFMELETGVEFDDT